MYLIHGGSNSAIGDGTRPVYIAANGRATVTTYRMAATNATVGTSAGGVVYSEKHVTGIWYVKSITGDDKTALFNQTDGMMYVGKYSNSWMTEIYQAWNGKMAIRGLNNGTWSDWRNVVTSTANTAVGDASTPVYVAADGTVTTTGKTLAYNVNAQINAGTANQVAYYSGANEISGSANATIVDGCLNLHPNNGSYREGIRIYPNSNWATIVLGGNDLSATSGTSTNSWSIHNNNGAFYINLNNSSGAQAARIYGTSSGWAIGNTGRQSGYDVTTSSLYVNGNATFSGWTNVARCQGTPGTAGYTQIAEIQITGQYGNQPIVIEFCRRGDKHSSTMYIHFAGTNNTDPSLSNFYIYGPSPAYIKKTATSTWKIWVTKTENYDSIDILRCNVSQYMAGGITITWTTNVQSNSAVSGWTEASYVYKHEHFQAQFQRSNNNVSWNKGRDGAFVRLTQANGGYSTLWSIKTTSGSWDIGHYDYESGNDKYQNNLLFTYITDTAWNGSNTIESQIEFTRSGRICFKIGKNGYAYGGSLPATSTAIQGEVFFKT